MLQKAEESLQRRFSRSFQIALVGEGLCVGLVAGALVTAYRISLAHAEELLGIARSFVVENLQYLPIWIFATLVLMLIVAKLMMWEPYTQGSGIPQIDAEVAGKADMPWLRVTIAKFIEGTLCTLAGLSLGREGPAVQLGGMGGKAVSRLFKKGRGEERILVTCGAGAGMAAAFHAPLTGVMFTLEEIHRVFTAPLIISVMVSCTVADYFVSQVLGIAPVLSMKFALDLPGPSYPLVILMGIVVGILGALHNKGMFVIQDLYKKVDKLLPYSRLIIPFSLAIVVVFIFPELVCGGESIVKLLDNFAPKPMTLLLALLLGKYLFTAICFGSGAPGGTLFPLVVMGSLCGALFGNLAVSTTGLDSSYITNFMLLGISGLFAGVVRAPVTGIVLAFELTGTLDSLLAASLVSIIAYVSANLCDVEPFYEKLLHDFLGRRSSQDISDLEGQKILHTHIIETGSVLEGKKIQDIDWPDGMLVVTVDRCGSELIPHGDLHLQAMDRLLVIMNMDIEDDCEKQIKKLCRGVIGYR